MLDQEDTPAPPPVANRRARRRWPKLVLGMGVLFVIVLLVTWARAPGWVRDRIEASLEESLAVRATVADLSLSLSGDISIGSIQLVDLQGREVAMIEDLRAHGNPMSLIRGDYAVEAELGTSSFFLYQEPDGSWSSASLLREDDSDDDSDGDGEDEEARDGIPVFDLGLLAPKLRLTLAPLGAGARTLELDLASRVQDGNSFTLEHLRLSSDFVSGTIEGRLENLGGWSRDAGTALQLQDIKADLRYIPDGLREVLAPFVALDLTGADEEDLKLQLSGELRSFGPVALARNLQVDLQAGVGRLTLADFTAEGDLEAELVDGWLKLNSNLGLNGGLFDLTGEVDLAGLIGKKGARDTSFSVGLASVGVGAEFAPLLSALHPMLAASEALNQEGLEGTLDARVEFSISAPLVLASLRQRPGSFPLNALSAQGSLGLAAGLGESPMAKQLARTFNVDLSGKTLVEPFSFTIDRGRITYGKPWTWTIDGLQTRFTGSVGLDQTLDLTWHVPISDRLVRNSSVLQRLGGRELAVPVSGFLRGPKLDLQTPLRNLANDALQETLQSEILDRIEDLDVLSGEGLGDIPGGALGGILDSLGDRTGENVGGTQGDTAEPAKSNDPNVLLREANRLWAAQERAAAQPIYRRLRKEFRLSTAYLLNRKMVKERADWKP